MRTETRLTREDFMSPAWKRLKEHMQERIQQLRIQNDDPHQAAEQTATLRGKIAELKYLSDLERHHAQPDPASSGDD
jgi:hypothetical protein